MSFSVKFTILKSKNGNPVAKGILEYEAVEKTSRTLYPDNLDENGFAETKWDDSWKGDSIKVYCHTDGKRSGTPKYIETITLSSGKEFTLWP